MNTRLVPVAPWYRHRWPWLLMLGPFVVIVAGVFTAWLAFRSNDGLVADDYYKQGLAVNQVTARERRAEALDVRGELSFDAARRLVRLKLAPGRLAEAPAVLLMTLSHPTRSGLDRTLRMERDNSGGYSAAVDGDLPGRWYVALEDEARTWRLSGAGDVTAQPSLALMAASR